MFLWFLIALLNFAGIYLCIYKKNPPKRPTTVNILRSLTPQVYIKKTKKNPWTTVSTICILQPSHPPHDIWTLFFSHLHTLIHTPLLSVNFTFLQELRIGPNALHSSYLPSTLYPFLLYSIYHTTLTQSI